MIVASVCNEHRNSDLRADDKDILRAFNERFEELESEGEALRKRAEEAEHTRDSFMSAWRMLHDYARAEVSDWEGRNADRFWEANRFLQTIIGWNLPTTRDRIAELEAKLAGMKQEFRVAFKYANGEEGAFFNTTNVAYYRREFPFCTDFRVQSRYAPTEWKDVEPV